MINASATGWIDKFLALEGPLLEADNISDATFYRSIRSTGFIYGHIIAFDTQRPVETKGWTSEEISKVALLHTLYRVFRRVTSENSTPLFVEKAVSFYREMHPAGFNLFRRVLPENPPSHDLEKMIGERVQTNDNIISKNFSHIVTNALLFEDVLAFQQFLLHGAIPHNYLKKLEETIVSIVSLALNAKMNPSKYDELLTKLFEASVRFTKFSKVKVQDLENLQLDYFGNTLEKYYLLDMAGLALWNDAIMEEMEASFLYTLAELMKVPDEFVAESIASADDFIQTNKKHIPYFNYSNPVKHFYDQATQTVVVLITRNKKRLLKEISQSGELMVLLALSAKRDLNEKEKKKVKKQLLEICKTIPSLTIFLLPGGSLLLPILIKFIPKMLPSVFNENLEQE